MSTTITHSTSRRSRTPRRFSPTTNHRAPALGRNGRALALVTVPDHEIAGGFAGSFKTSPLQAQRFAQGVLAESSPLVSRAARARLMVQWASLSGTPAQRQTLVKAYRAAGLELVLIQQMSELPRAQTAAFMKDYFAAGGAIGVVGDWLALAGSALRRPTVARQAIRGNGKVAAKAFLGGLLDEVGGWIKDTASKAGDAFVDAVGSVVDAVVSAGKSLGDAISSAVNWTVDQCTDLVEGLVRAGKKVADILTTAAAKGLTTLKKFVEAVVDAGRSIGEVIEWAATKVVTTVNAVVDTLLKIGKTIGQVLVAAANATATAANAVVKALIALGKPIVTILGQLGAQAASIMQRVVNALLVAGVALSAVLASAAALGATVCQGIVRALRALGKALGPIFTAAGNFTDVILDALLAIGTALGEILLVVPSLTAAVAQTVVKALIGEGKTVTDIVVTVSTKAVSVARAVFQALINIGRKVAEILSAVAGRTLSAIQTVYEGLIAMGVTVGTIAVTVLDNIEEGFHKSFFEGLVAIGKGLLQILKAVAEVKLTALPIAFAVVAEMCGGQRDLNPTERKEAEKIFGTSIDLDRVKIAVASLPADVINYVNGGRPFTSMYVINFASWATVEMHDLIHELTHVWQGVQTGPLYMVRALEAQIGAGVTSLFHTGKYDDSTSYDVFRADLVAAGGDFSRFNPEQQATIVERYWMARFGGSTLSSDLGDVAQYQTYAVQVKSKRPRAAVMKSRRLAGIRRERLALRQTA
jgi:hypothetical protein